MTLPILSNLPGLRSNAQYEYLLKQYLLSGRTKKYLLDMYIAATDAMIDNTLYLSPTRNLLYVTDVYTWNCASLSRPTIERNKG